MLRGGTVNAFEHVGEAGDGGYCGGGEACTDLEETEGTKVGSNRSPGNRLRHHGCKLAERLLGEGQWGEAEILTELEVQSPARLVGGPG